MALKELVGWFLISAVREWVQESKRERQDCLQMTQTELGEG